MTADTLLTELSRQGLTLRLLPTGTLAAHPKERLTDDLRNVLREHKSDLVTLLRGRAPSPPPPLPPAKVLALPFPARKRQGNARKKPRPEESKPPPQEAKRLEHTISFMARLTGEGLTFARNGAGELGVEPEAALSSEHRGEIAARKADILTVLDRKKRFADQPTHLPRDPTFGKVPTDAKFWAAEGNLTLERWRQGDYGRCGNCGETAWYQHMDFLLCRVCVPPREEHQ
jgi:hypothetical protein